MPLYPCTRCGETVDTGPSFAPPLNILCPDCRGGAPNPLEARQAPTPPTPRAPLLPTYAPAPPPLPLHPSGRGIPWWVGVTISHLLAIPTLIVIGIAENEKEVVIEGTLGGALFGIFMLFILDGVSLLVGLAGAGILRLFKLHFGRSLALVSSIVLVLSVALILLGFLLPEEVGADGESALPKVEAVEKE